MNLENFLNPADEDLIDPNPQDLDSIIASYTIPSSMAQVNEPNSDDDDGNNPPPSPPSSKQTLEALQTVLQYEECSKKSRKKNIQMLEQLKRCLKTLFISQQSQWTLDSWIM